MPSHIKLYGDKSERFEELKKDLTEQLGYEPSNPEVIGLLMGAADMENILTATTDPSATADSGSSTDPSATADSGSSTDGRHNRSDK